MTISLSPETQKLLEEKLRASEYTSADDLVYAALLSMDQDPEMDPETADAIYRAEKAVAEGNVYDWDDVREIVKAKLSGQ